MNEKETMNVQMEKFFFTWILDHSSQFFNVEPEYFKNDEIRFIYKVVRDEYIISKNIPTPQQIVAMIKLHDPEEKINNNVIKVLLKNDNSVHDQEWMDRHFRAWKLSNEVRNKIYIAIDEIRNLKEIDYDNVLSVVSKIKTTFSSLSIIEDNDEDLGDDFDDPESHKQEAYKNKIPSGWDPVDAILHGGWDKGTFNVYMGETNVGKCCKSTTYIKIKNKKTNEIKEITYVDFYKLLKSNVSFTQ